MIDWDMTYVFFASNFVTRCTFLQYFLSMAQKEDHLQDSEYGHRSEMLQGGGACQTVWVLFSRTMRFLFQHVGCMAERGGVDLVL